MYNQKKIYCRLSYKEKNYLKNIFTLYNCLLKAFMYHVCDAFNIHIDKIKSTSISNIFKNIVYEQ